MLLSFYGPANSTDPNDSLASEIRAMLASTQEDARFAAVAFTEALKRMWNANQLFADPIDPTQYNDLTLRPTATLWQREHSGYNLYLTWIDSGGRVRRSPEARAVLATNGVLPLRRRLETSVDRHNRMA